MSTPRVCCEVCVCVCVCVFTVHSVCSSGVWHRVRACCALSVSTLSFLLRKGDVEGMITKSCLTPTHALYCPREEGRGGRWTTLRAHVCGGRHVHVVNTHSHALLYTALHYSCSVQCSLCTVSVQWSVAQSACVLRALSVHAVFSFAERGCRRHDH